MWDSNRLASLAGSTYVINNYDQTAAKYKTAAKCKTSSKMQDSKCLSSSLICNKMWNCKRPFITRHSNKMRDNMSVTRHSNKTRDSMSFIIRHHNKNVRQHVSEWETESNRLHSTSQWFVLCLFTARWQTKEQQAFDHQKHKYKMWLKFDTMLFAALTQTRYQNKSNQR